VIHKLSKRYSKIPQLTTTSNLEAVAGFFDLVIFVIQSEGDFYRLIHKNETLHFNR